MTLVESFDELMWRFRPYFKRIETFERARAFAFSHAITYGRHTVSRMICSKNDQFKDWSADYKFFSNRDWDAGDLVFELFKECDHHSHWYNNSIVTVMDSSQCKKSSRKIPGVRTLRDPMSLPFHTNLTPAIRFLQVSAVVNPEDRLDTVRAVPIYFQQAAPAKKPRSNASDDVKERYKIEQKAKRLSVVGHQTALEIRNQVNALPEGANRLLFLSVDGALCNRCFLRDFPKDIVYIARTRKDIKIHKPANSELSSKGRHRVYGDRLPTPEQIRQSDDYPWQTERIYAAGKYHDLRYKTVAPILWRNGTGAVPQRLIVIAPLRYRKSKNSRLLYRNPAYLLAPDVDVSMQYLLQYYFYRWDIEVNNRDEKSLIGLGDAQVRSIKSVERTLQFSMIVYSMLLLAGMNAYGCERTRAYLPLPKWNKETVRRPSTLDILAEFRREIMVDQLNHDIQLNSSPQKKKKYRKMPRSRIEAKKRGFVKEQQSYTKPEKWPVHILSAIVYADS